MGIEANYFFSPRGLFWKSNRLFAFDRKGRKLIVSKMSTRRRYKINVKKFQVRVSLLWHWLHYSCKALIWLESIGDSIEEEKETYLFLNKKVKWVKTSKSTFLSLALLQYIRITGCAGKENGEPKVVNAYFFILCTEIEGKKSSKIRIAELRDWDFLKVQKSRSLGDVRPWGGGKQRRNRRGNKLYKMSINFHSLPAKKVFEKTVLIAIKVFFILPLFPIVMKDSLKLNRSKEF